MLPSSFLVHQVIIWVTHYQARASGFFGINLYRKTDTDDTEIDTDDTEIDTNDTQYDTNPGTNGTNLGTNGTNLGTNGTKDNCKRVVYKSCSKNGLRHNTNFPCVWKRFTVPPSDPQAGQLPPEGAVGMVKLKM